MLKWATAELFKMKDKPLAFSETVNLKKELQARDADIIDATDFQVEGSISIEARIITVNYTLKGALTIPSTRSLAPVNFPIDRLVTELFVKEDQQVEDEVEVTVILLENDVLDLQDSILDNIILSIPMQVLTPEEEANEPMPSGNEWEVISEEDYIKLQENTDRPNPKFAALKDLLDDPSKLDD